MKKIKKIFSLSTIVILIIAFLSSFSPFPVPVEEVSASPGWLEDYAYRVEIPVNGVSGGESDYQMKITLEKNGSGSSAGIIDLNGHSVGWASGVPVDIRFTRGDGTTPVDFWREEYDATDGTWWIELPIIPISPATTSYYLYYGKSGDTDESDGANTFIFFDDFLGTSLDTDIWGVDGTVTGYSVANSKLTITSSADTWHTLKGFHADISQQNSFSLEVKDFTWSQSGNSPMQHVGITLSNETDAWTPLQVCFYDCWDVHKAAKRADIEGNNYQTGYDNLGLSGTAQWRITKLPDNSSEIYWNDISVLGPYTSNESFTKLYIRVNTYKDYGFGTCTIDRILMRKLISDEPAWASPGPEESVPPCQEHNVWGWAWSENIGWICFSCKSDGANVNYGVDINTSTGKLSGHAWSRGTANNPGGIGWISFEPTDVAGCPSGAGTCQAEVDLDTGKLSGWARACTVFQSGCSGALKPDSERGGWDGWISLTYEAEDWLEGYQYRVEIPVNGTSDGENDYQMKITLEKDGSGSSAGIIDLDGHSAGWVSGVPVDIRFTEGNGTTPVDFWREEYDATDGTWWVELPIIPVSPATTSYYLYYGKSGDTDESDGANTFLFFEDASLYTTDTENPDDWSISLGQYNVANEVWCRETRRGQGTFDYGSKVIETWSISSSQGGANTYIRASHTVGLSSGTYKIDFDWLTSRSYSSPNRYYIRAWVNGATQIWSQDSNPIDTNTWYDESIEVTDLINSIQVGNYWVGQYTVSQSEAWDDIRIRKYTSPEPAWASPGGELEESPGGGEEGVWIDIDENSPTYQEFLNWAWGGDDASETAIIGWISFNCFNPESGDVCGASDYKVETSLVFAGPNNPPIADFECTDPSNCGSVTPSCIGYVGYNDCVIVMKNNSTDTDSGDTLTSTWYRINGEEEVVDSCSGNPGLCNLTPNSLPTFFPLPGYEESQSYIIKLDVTDGEATTASEEKTYEHRRSTVADFRCSLDGEVWSICGELGEVEPGSVVYFWDGATTTYPDESSYPSCCGNTIDSRIWRRDEVEFGEPNNSLVSTALVSFPSDITLKVTDSAGRWAREGYTIQSESLVVPLWKEVSP